jgi:CubicO group peptidase (beta-lactamase class C family)
VLVDEGKVRWDDTVRTYVPTLHFPDPYLDREVTLRDVLAHRVGLNPGNWMFRFLNEDGQPASLDRVAFLRPQAPFRTTLVYANYGYTIAGEVISKASGMPWRDFIRQRLVEPLGLRETQLGGDMPDVGNVARPHALIQGRQQVIRSGSGEQSGPSSFVRSTVSDLARWLRFQLGDGEIDGRRLISAQAMYEMHAPQVLFPVTPAMKAARLVTFFPGYGLGWQVMDYRGHPMMWHSGAADGMTSYMAMLPADRLGVVVLMNSSIAPGLHGALASRLLDSYLGVPPRDWSGELLAARGATPATPPPAPNASPSATVQPGRPLDAYTGRYDEPLFGPIHIRLDNGTLSLQLAGGKIADLIPLETDRMSVRWRDPLLAELFQTTVTFRDDASSGKLQLAMQLNRDTVTAVRR